MVLTILLALATLAAASPGRVGGTGTIVILLISLLIIVGGSGEAFVIPSPDVANVSPEPRPDVRRVPAATRLDNGAPPDVIR